MCGMSSLMPQPTEEGVPRRRSSRGSRVAARGASPGSETGNGIALFSERD